MFGEGVAEFEAHHGVLCFAVFGVEGGEVFGEFGEGIATVEVVGIDHGEGAIDVGFGGEDGLGGAPGFDAAFWDGEAVGEVVEALEGVVDGDFLVEFAADFGFEFVFKIAADDEDDFVEAGAEGVEDGVVEDGFAMWTHGVELFEAAVTAAHAGCEDK